MQVQGNIIIRRKAKDAVSVSLSPESIALKQSNKQQTVGVTVGVTVGNTALPYYKSAEACFVCGTPKGTNNSYIVPDALKWSYDTRTGFVMKFTLLAGKEVNIDVKFDVTYYPQGTNNAPAIKWEKTVSIVTCKDGDKGDKGDKGDQGDKGIPGLIVRTTEWAAGVEYHNDENLTGGIRYLDVAMVTNSQTGLVNMFQCRKTHVSTDANKPQAGVATAEWKTVNMERMPIYTPLIIADNAVLRFGQTNRMLIMDIEGKKIQGCVTGVDEPTKPMAWFGGETAGVSNTSISYDGKLKTKDGYFEGTVAGVQGSFSKLYGGYWDNGTLNVNDKAYIEFSKEYSSLAIHGSTYIEGETLSVYSKNFYHMTSGLNGEKPARLITQNVWCGGSFGAAQRVTVVISMNKATYYLSGTDEILYQRDARELRGTLIGDKTVYQIECYPPYITADDLKNVIVDTVIFDGANTTDMYYYLELRATQRVMVISANNTPRYKTYLYITGKLWNLEGGYAMFVTMLPSGLLKPGTKGLGADQLVCGAYDNNW